MKMKSGGPKATRPSAVCTSIYLFDLNFTRERVQISGVFLRALLARASLSFGSAKRLIAVRGSNTAAAAAALRRYCRHLAHLPFRFPLPLSLSVRRLILLRPEIHIKTCDHLRSDIILVLFLALRRALKKSFDWIRIQIFLFCLTLNQTSS